MGLVLIGRGVDVGFSFYFDDEEDEELDENELDEPDDEELLEFDDYYECDRILFFLLFYLDLYLSFLNYFYLYPY